MVHFVSVNGIGRIKANDTNEEYVLKGSNDILGMVIPVANQKEVTVTAERKNFGFYVYIEPRNVINFDEIEY